MQEYSDFAQLSEMKRELTSLKIDLQKSSYELQAQKQINRELSSANSELHQKLKQSHQKQLTLQQRLNVMSDNYQIQIEELKVLVDSRSEELEELSRQILPKVDEDMLRIRLLNQLEIPHREEIQEKQREIGKARTYLLEVEKDNEVLQNKIQTLQQMKGAELNDARREYTADIVIYKTELQLISQQISKQRDYSKKLKKEIEELKQKQSILKQKHLSEIQELNKENNKMIMNYGSDNEVRNLKTQIHQKNNQIKDQKEEVMRLRKGLESSKEQYSRLQYQYDQIKAESSTLKQLIDTHQLKQLQFKLAAERQFSNETNMRALKKQIGLKSQQNSILLQKIRLLQDTRGKAAVQNTSIQANYLKYDIQILENKLKDKQTELQSLLQKLNSKPNKQPSLEQRKPREARSPDRNLKQKLNIANSKIVQLLKQKIVLKEQIKKLSLRM